MNQYMYGLFAVAYICSVSILYDSLGIELLQQLLLIPVVVLEGKTGKLHNVCISR